MESATMKFHSVLLRVLLLILTVSGAAWAQTTGSITGTVKDPTGAAIAGATVVVASPERGINRQMLSNSTGEYNESGLPAGTYDIIVTAPGFKKYQAKGVKLDVAEKARVDVTLQVGAATTEVIVEGTAVAQVETQSSDLAGTVTGRQITQLELNGRNYTSLVTLVPGVSFAPGAPDEPAVGISNIYFSINGGRTEYNNWELDGGDNMDNGSNNTLNVYPSIDAIAEFKVLTSNYGAQYGRNGSGTIEVETKGGTKSFHGDAYEFVRNDYFNAVDYTDQIGHGGNGHAPPYKKNDYGFTIGGPAYIPGLYNRNKDKTFFFWSEEWRKERVPNSYSSPVPYSAERTGDFTDLCPDPAVSTTFQRDDPEGANYFPDCPGTPSGTVGVWDIFPSNTITPTATGTALEALIPVGTLDTPGASVYNKNASLPTNWREELFKVDHNLTQHNRVTFRYIHDSWSTLEASSIWSGSTFPNVQTFFNGPGISMVARLTSTITPTLLNEFVSSYTTDHIAFKSQGAYAQPSGFSMGYLFPNGGVGKLPTIGFNGGIYGGIYEDAAGEWPEGAYNSNPTYTDRDNMTKIVGRHNLQFGAYLAAAQKNELSSIPVAGSLTFDISSPVTTGNPFADMLLGNIASFQQGSSQIKFYNRYKIIEPYFQDDWRVTDRLTLNLGLRLSLMVTYRDRYKHTYNWDPAIYAANAASGPQIDVDGSITGAAGALVSGVGNPLLGLVLCGSQGGSVSLLGFPDAAVGGTSNVGCSAPHLFNPAPRVGFAWDPWGNGRTAIRGGYGVFFEHTNGNEANTEGMEGQTSPLLQTETQNNVVGYANIGGGGGSFSPTFPFSFYSIPRQVRWPYVQQFHFDVQHELPAHFIVQASYVGSKGTHLGRQRDLNQLYPATQNPYAPGQPITAADCNGISLAPVTAIATATPGPGTTYTTAQTGGWANNLAVACGNTANPYRPFYGMGTVTLLEPAASSIYHALQLSARKTVGDLNLSVAYTWSHSIDDSSDRYDGGFVNSYNLAMTRASSQFDQRHLLNISYVYDLPFFKKAGLTHTMLGGWEWSGIVAFSTGIPLNVTNGSTYGDNAGVGNGVGTSSFPDVISNPRANVPPPSQVTSNAYAGYFYNPAAFTAPTGLTFGNIGRNYLRDPNRTNFDMALFKHFAIKENVAFEFRAEAFNVFNHSQWTPGSGTFGSPAFFEISGAHNARILQLGAKFIF
jgi:hypothetical protein